MTALNYPRHYASDATFTSGPDTGNPTKVDPGAAVEQQGLIPGTVVAAQVVNHTLNSHAQAARFMAEQALLRIAAFPVIDDVGLGYGLYRGTGVAIPSGANTVVVKGGTNGVFVDAGGSLRAQAPGSANVTDALGGCQLSNGDLVVVGASGEVAGSDDGGLTWDIIDDLGAGGVRDAVPYTTGVIVAAENGAVHTGSLAGLTSQSLSASHDPEGIATDGSTVLVLRGSANQLQGFDSSSNGTTYADTAGTVIGTTAGFGAVTSDGTNYYWAGVLNSGNLSVQASSDAGVTWSEIENFAPAFTASGIGTNTRLVAVPGTSVMWMAIAQSGSAEWYLYASADGGLNWVGGTPLGSTFPVLSVANGHLYVGSANRAMSRTFWRLA